jgi:hypothetical protein
MSWSIRSSAVLEDRIPAVRAIAASPMNRTMSSGISMAVFMLFDFIRLTSPELLLIRAGLT